MIFLGVACLLVAGVTVVFPQIRETAEDAARKIERRAEEGKPPPPEKFGGDWKTLPWGLLAAGVGLTFVGVRVRRAA